MQFLFNLLRNGFLFLEGLIEKAGRLARVFYWNFLEIRIGSLQTIGYLGVKGDLLLQERLHVLGYIVHFVFVEEIYFGKRHMTYDLASRCYF